MPDRRKQKEGRLARIEKQEEKGRIRRFPDCRSLLEALMTTAAPEIEILLVDMIHNVQNLTLIFGKVQFFSWPMFGVINHPVIFV